MSVEAMRAAVIAVRAGAFDGPPAASDAVVQVSAARPTPPLPSPGHFDAPTVVVLAAHAGAGASTVALTVAEALSVHQQVQLIEYADPHQSGLDAASSSELGVDESGWRRGRRGHIDLARMATDCSTVDGFPLRLPVGNSATPGDRLLVIDAGQSAMSVLSRSWVTALRSVVQLVVVSRVTVPALRQTEHLLSALEVPAVLACVGPARWPGMVTAGCGPALRAARAAGRVVTVPVNRRLAVAGLTPDPLPRPVAAAGRALVDLLTFDTPVLPDPSATPLRELADVAVAAR